MSRPKSTTEKVRLTLELSKAVRQRIDELREKTNAESATEVIRRALALYDVVLSSCEDPKLVVKNKDGVTEILTIKQSLV